MGCQSITGITPSSKFASTHLYTWVERGTVRVKCLAQEHNAAPRPGLEPGPLDPEASALTIRPPRLPPRREVLSYIKNVSCILRNVTFHCYFYVHLFTQDPVVRTLCLSETCIIERDPATYIIVSCHPLSNVSSSLCCAMQ